MKNEKGVQTHLLLHQKGKLADWVSTELDNWWGEEPYTREQKDVLPSLQGMGSQISWSKRAKTENFTQLCNANDQLRKDKILRVVQKWDKEGQNEAGLSLYLGLKVIWWWHFLVYFLWALTSDNLEYFVLKLQWHVSLERVDLEVLKSHIWLKNHGTGHFTLRDSPNSNDQLGQKYSLLSSFLTSFILL